MNAAQIKLKPTQKKILRCIMSFYKKGKNQTPESIHYNGNYQNIHCFGGCVYFGNYKSTTMAVSDVQRFFSMGILETVKGNDNKFKLSDVGAKLIIITFPNYK